MTTEEKGPTMHDQTPLTEAEAFFYEHAGCVYQPATETFEQGARRGAVELARAEAALRAGPYAIEIEDDPMPWDGDVPWDGPLYIVSLTEYWSGDAGYSSRILGALGSVACNGPDDPYLRVIAAELASEYLS